VSDKTTTPLFPFVFRLGHFVKCSYDYTLTWWIEEGSTRVFYGVVVGCHQKDIYFPYGTFYDILCTDGHLRYFAEWEIKHVKKPDK